MGNGCRNGGKLYCNRRRFGTGPENLKDVPNPDNKVIILLTDGENNDGSMSLAQAVKLARDAGIKAYTIGVGSPNNFLPLLWG